MEGAVDGEDHSPELGESVAPGDLDEALHGVIGHLDDVVAAKPGTDLFVDALRDAPRRPAAAFAVGETPAVQLVHGLAGGQDQGVLVQHVGGGKNLPESGIGFHRGGDVDGPLLQIAAGLIGENGGDAVGSRLTQHDLQVVGQDRKSTRLNSSH